ncbi:MAG TPA: hypothetical protein VEI82_12200 [Myxococcota bacterium]|nr:hypothetical protein [Myxococcota bacterium]
MKTQTVQFCLRIPKEAYDQAVDVARVFDLSLNQFFLRAIRSYVESQLGEDVIRNAVAKTHEARRAGLVSRRRGEGASAKPGGD